ncbi:IS630 family transposase [Nocardia terpenica]|uniref:IS630 family transposase n=1 Tax=Nocardia terpenica TaxID=455432 RepID=A0A291REB1_9NOCA|nr:IS630 family transposase [Nocardia terpenica]ATL65648.1 IS630 family transposase [Nocardia terpenica]ATL66446.1 IS630 family transposase [Nocardia terpenica]ATL66796.1 IS630 family transposase [Nocardia terpenica]ATL68091.1 IS630 family transposase [Nocardia terpenica]ATL69206.1 IS630 family transposase [Nocardia terpenica]
MRPASVFAKGRSSADPVALRRMLRGPCRQGLRAVMVFLSLGGMEAVAIAALLEVHPSTVREWIHRFDLEGVAGLADRPRPGRPRLGGPRLLDRITLLLKTPGPWTIPRIWQRLGRPAMSLHSLSRRVRQVAVWRRPKLIGRGDPDHDRVVAAIRSRLLRLPRRALVFVEDETHVNWLPHVRASWTLWRHRPEVLTPGKNQRVTVYGALDVTSGEWIYQLGSRCAAEFVELLRFLLDEYPRAPRVVVICDNDKIHTAGAVARFVTTHPRLLLLFGARYSPHDNPVERVWGALKNYIANTAVTWPGRRRQIHTFFRTRSPDGLLTAAAPWTSPWLPPDYATNYWNAA